MSFEDQIDAVVQAAAKDVYKRGCLIVDSVLESHHDEENNIIYGEVDGSDYRPYDTLIHYKTKKVSCTCFYYTQHKRICKHIVALGLHALEEIAYQENAYQTNASQGSTAPVEPSKNVTNFLQQFEFTQQNFRYDYTSEDPIPPHLKFVLIPHQKPDHWLVKMITYDTEDQIPKRLKSRTFRKADTLLRKHNFFNHRGLERQLKWVKDNFEESSYFHKTKQPSFIPHYFHNQELLLPDGSALNFQNQCQLKARFSLVEFSTQGQETYSQVLMSPVLVPESLEPIPLVGQPFSTIGEKDFAILLNDQFYPLDPQFQNLDQVQFLLTEQAFELSEFNQLYSTIQPQEQFIIQEELHPQTIIGQPQPIIEIKRGGNRFVSMSLWFYYPEADQKIKYSSDPEFHFSISQDHRAFLIARNLEVELKYLTELNQLVEACNILDEELSEDNFNLVTGDYRFEFMDVPELVHHVIEALSDDWKMNGLQYLNKYLSRTGQFVFSVKSRQDWFDLDGFIDFGQEQIPLAELLQMNTPDVELKDGSKGVIPSQALELLQFASGITSGHASGVNPSDPHALSFQPEHQAILRQLAQDSQVEIKAKQQLLKKLSKPVLKAPAKLKPPKKLRATLREYQEDGIHWLRTMYKWGTGGILADDMGLGKTLQIIAHLIQVKSGPHLIIMPTSLIYNWLNEFDKFAPHLKVNVYHGNDRDPQIITDTIEGQEILLTTYPLIMRDVEAFQDLSWNHIILDESQAIKNPTSKTHLAVCSLEAQHRLCMTGTPIENNLMDLWAQFQFINPGLLGGIRFFKGHFLGETEDHKLNVLKNIIEPFYLRRTKSVVLKDLPPKEEVISYIEMSPGQEKLYHQTRLKYQKLLTKQFQSDGFNKSQMKVLEGLLRLRQIACAPQLMFPNSQVASSKVDFAIDKLMEDIQEGHRALVFSQFTSLLKIVAQRLDQLKIAYSYLDGSTKKRQEQIEQFTGSTDHHIFLISLKAGGTGLNLVQADYVFHLDPWWNPAVEDQATDRAHRIGQVHKVVNFKLISKDTVEEKILAMQADKRELAQKVFKSDKGFLKSLNKENVLQLFDE